MEIIEFTDGATRCEIWDLPDNGWDEWSTQVDRFLTHAISGILAEYDADSVDWLEINGWPTSGRLITFPSKDGPFGNRSERVCFELSSKHLEATCSQIGASVAVAEREAAWVALSRRVWNRVSESLMNGVASQELSAGRRRHKLLIAGFDYDPGENLCWLTKDGLLRDHPGPIEVA